MFFTKIGNVFAYFGLLIGVFLTSSGVLIAFATENAESRIAFSKRYFANSNTGEVIDKGLIFIIASVFIGILCEISKARKTEIAKTKPKME